MRFSGQKHLPAVPGFSGSLRLSVTWHEDPGGSICEYLSIECLEVVPKEFRDQFVAHSLLDILEFCF